MEPAESTIRFRLDTRSGVAPYRQLVDQVRAAIAAGRLMPGDQLPAVREVVTQITINPNTVHRAYRELEYLGLSEARRGLGTFVATHATTRAATAPPDTEGDVVLFVAGLRERGWSDEQIRELVSSELERRVEQHHE